MSYFNETDKKQLRWYSIVGFFGACCLTITTNVEWLCINPDRTIAEQLQMRWGDYLLIFLNTALYCRYGMTKPAPEGGNTDEGD